MVQRSASVERTDESNEEATNKEKNKALLLLLHYNIFELMNNIYFSKRSPYEVYQVRIDLSKFVFR
jgi:hypothetical protein